MENVTETKVPGVGVRHEMQIRGGRRIGVLTHHGGRRDLLMYSQEDPDACRTILSLEPDESFTVAQLLGATQLAEHVAAVEHIEGIGLDWITVQAGSEADGRSLVELAVHTRTGVAIVAIVRGEETVPAPRADFVLHAGDVAVSAGTPEGLRAVTALLQAA